MTQGTYLIAIANPKGCVGNTATLNLGVSLSTFFQSVINSLRE